MIEYSTDNKNWEIVIDKTLNKEDVPHNYIQLKTPIKARYLKLTNYYVPDGTFAIPDFRVFGNGQDMLPQVERNLKIVRDAKDKCVVDLKWDKDENAVGYNIRFGIEPTKLYHTYQVLESDSVTIRSLNKHQTYYFSIDTFNENGVLKGSKIITV